MSYRRMGVALERGLTLLMFLALWGSAAFLGLGLILVLAGRDAEAVLTAGLLMLMATPMFRVVLAILEAARRRDWLTLTSTLAVLAILIGGTLRHALTRS